MHSGSTLIGQRAHTASDIPDQLCTHHVLQGVNIHSKGKSLTPIEIAIASIYLPILINNKAALTSSSNEKLRATLRSSIACEHWSKSVYLHIYRYIVDRS